MNQFICGHGRKVNIYFNLAHNECLSKIPSHFERSNERSRGSLLRRLIRTPEATISLRMYEANQDVVCKHTTLRCNAPSLANPDQKRKTRAIPSRDQSITPILYVLRGI